LNKKSTVDTPKARIDWLDKDGPGPFLIAIYVVDHERYIKNKALAMRRWTEVLSNDNRF
jgi:hypothetical protein